MNTAVITGASGFLGSNLVQAFLKEGWAVAGIDRLPPRGHPTGGGGYSFHQLRLPCKAFRVLLAGLRPSLVIHAAGPSSVFKSIQSPIEDFKASLVPTVQILEAVRLGASDAKVVFLSSAAVYGNQKSLPISEDAPLAPLSPYGFHKAMGEMAVKEYATVFGVSACSVRIFSAYGVGLSRQVMWDICGMALGEGEVTLHGTGRESRDFIHVQDISQGVRLIADHAPMCGEVFNLATGEDTTIADLALGLVHALGVDAKVSFTGVERPGDPDRWRADVTRVAGLGFTPIISMQRGISEYAEWLRMTQRHDEHG